MQEMMVVHYTVSMFLSSENFTLIPIAFSSTMTNLLTFKFNMYSTKLKTGTKKEIDQPLKLYSVCTSLWSYNIEHSNFGVFVSLLTLTSTL